MGTRGRRRTNRRRPGTAAVALLVLAAGFGVSATPAAYAAELSPCVHPDNGTPRIHEVSFSPEAGDVTEGAQQVTLRMRVVDVGGPGPASGVASVSARVGPDVVGAKGRSLVELSDVGGDWWEGDFTVLPGATSGAWRVEATEVLDHAWNALSDPDDLGHDFLAPHAESNVQVTSTPDTEPPTVTSLDLSPRKIDTRRRAREVKVRVGAVDDLSGVRSVQVTARGDGGRSVSADLTASDGDTFTGALRFPRRFGRGEWRIRYLGVTDGIGNEARFFSSSIDQFGEREFRVVAPLVAEDSRQPRLVWHRVRPRTLDIRRDEERVRVRARLRDGGSGVRSAGVHLFGRHTEMKRVRGTARDGVWVARFMLDPCAGFETRRGSFRISDKAGNWLSHDFRARTTVRRLDNAPPRPTHYDNRLDPEGPLTFRFSEPVNGIHDGSILVQPKSWPAPLGPPVPGTWTCRDGAGDLASCADGKVRQVVWAPDGPLPEGTYRVSLNPDGVLDVTDLRGNPIERDATEPEDFFELRVLG